MKIKHPKSPILTAAIKQWSKPRPLSKETLQFLAEAGDYPHNCRGEVFCWLWVNHAELTEILWRWEPSWAGVAEVMAHDGVKDANGAAPNGNAVRRVWGRVCRDIEADRVEKARKAKQ